MARINFPSYYEPKGNKVRVLAKIIAWGIEPSV